jgi:hypothetical protein
MAPISAFRQWFLEAMAPVGVRFLGSLVSTSLGGLQPQGVDRLGHLAPMVPSWSICLAILLT